MGSVPKPAFLQIRGLDNEKAIARYSTEDSGLFVRSVEKLPVFVTVQWRDAEQVPTLLSILSEIPKAPRGHALEVLKRDDGKYTLIPQLCGPKHGISSAHAAVEAAAVEARRRLRLNEG